MKKLVSVVGYMFLATVLAIFAIKVAGTFRPQTFAEAGVVVSGNTILINGWTDPVTISAGDLHVGESVNLTVNADGQILRYTASETRDYYVLWTDEDGNIYAEVYSATCAAQAEAEFREDFPEREVYGVEEV